MKPKDESIIPSFNKTVAAKAKAGRVETLSQMGHRLLKERPVKHRPVYRGTDGWVLAICTQCQRTNYCEPHGTTAPCLCTGRQKGKWTEHTPIPEDRRLSGLMGEFVIVDYKNRLKGMTDE